MPKKEVQSNVETSYTDVMMPSSKDYSYPGSRFSCSNGDAVIEPDSRKLTFIGGFSVFFIPAFSLVAFFFIPPPGKWLFIAASPILFGIIYFLVRHEINRGPYIEFRSKTDEIALPRLDKVFRKSDVTLQWITGYSELNPDIHTDLNLIVAENGINNRYYVLGGPNEMFVEKFAELSGAKLVKVRGKLG